jgi:hypothetical protein
VPHHCEREILALSLKRRTDKLFTHERMTNEREQA